MEKERAILCCWSWAYFAAVLSSRRFCVDWVRLSIWGTSLTVSFWTCNSIDLVSCREFDRELSIEAMSTSVARARVHDLAGAIAIRRPGNIVSDKSQLVQLDHAHPAV